MIKSGMVLAREIGALRHALGEGVCAALLDPMVVEVMANDDGAVWVDRLGEGRGATGLVISAAAAETVIRLIASHIDEPVGRARPEVAGTLPESGERFQGVLPPLAQRPIFTIRKRPPVVWGLEDYVGQGIMTAAQAGLLRRAAGARENVLIAGGTGSGKTTLANALLAEPAFRDDRIVLIEDTPELQCVATDKVGLLSRRAEPAITLRDLVKMTLRLRPDRIVIGELRDGGALDLLKAWNTGHPGGVATLHANSPRDALYRLEELIGEVSAHIPRRAIAAAIRWIVFIARIPRGRRVEAVTRVGGHDDHDYVLHLDGEDEGGFEAVMAGRAARPAAI